MRTVLAVSAGVWLASAVGVITTGDGRWIGLCIASGVLTGMFGRIVHDEYRARPHNDPDPAALLGLDDMETP